LYAIAPTRVAPGRTIALVYKRQIFRQPATAAGMNPSTLRVEPPWLSTADDGAYASLARLRLA
jgi:hypothetical protein